MATPDFMPGDPKLHVVGKDDEQPARVHAPQPPKPTKTARGIAADIELRMQELKPLVDEYAVLVELSKILPPSRKE